MFNTPTHPHPHNSQYSSDCMSLIVALLNVALFFQISAGPTGLTLAISLSKNDIPFRIIDKKQQHSLGQRGSTIQVRGNLSHKI